MQNDKRPIIIKRKKIVAGGHHGGAWKVAYADFVTAMMAFFMLMWLLNATTEKQRKGIADYFNPTIPVNRVSGGGDGAFGGDSIFSEDTLVHNGTGASQSRAMRERQARGVSGVTLDEDIQRAREGMEALLQGRTGDSLTLRSKLIHIATRVSDEGLIMELFDTDGATLFVPETDTPTRLLHDLIDVVASVYLQSLNSVAVEAHVRSYPVPLARNPVWDLTTARAGATRRVMEEAGFPPARLQRVTGYADRRPAAADRASPRNNRVEIILLRKK